jgi:membrane-bound ClpP family serine protease
LLTVFRMERIAYLVTTLVAVIFLLSAAAILMSRESYVMAVGMFGASGVIAYTIGRVLQMWNQMVNIIFGPEPGGKP